MFLVQASVQVPYKCRMELTNACNSLEPKSVHARNERQHMCPGHHVREWGSVCTLAQEFAFVCARASAHARACSMCASVPVYVCTRARVCMCVTVGEYVYTPDARARHVSLKIYFL